MLSDLKIKGLKPTGKVYRQSDGQVKGLSIEVRPKGEKYWRFRYKNNEGKYTMLSLGEYPSISLSKARQIAQEKRGYLAEGIDINRSQNNSFSATFSEWIEKKGKHWTDNYRQSVKTRVEQNVLPYIGDKSVSEINSTHLLPILDRIEGKGFYNTAHKVYQYITAIFGYAIAKRLTDRNPAVDIKGYLTPLRKRGYPTPDMELFKHILRSNEAYNGSFITQKGLSLLILTMLRPGEIRRMKWEYVDFNEKLINIPDERMKMKRSHIVPLSTQALDILEQMSNLTGRSEWVFTGEYSTVRPMSENTLNFALRRMGFSKEEVVAHSFRKVASTFLNEQGWNKDWVEMQLAHVDSSVRGVYNKALYLEGRREMLQAWADEISLTIKG